MKKIIVIVVLFYFSILMLNAENKENVTAYEGYQLVKEKLKAEHYDLSNIKLIRTSGIFYLDKKENFFSGDEIGKTFLWTYLVNCKKNKEEKYLDVSLSIWGGKTEISIAEKNDIPSKTKFINLTKDNDSPVFAKKLLDNNEFVDDLEFFKNLDNLNAESGQNKVLAFILFNYLSPNLSIFKNNNIQIQENTPYWSFNISVGGNNGYNTICILPADKNIHKNALEFINMNNNKKD